MSRTVYIDDHGVLFFKYTLTFEYDDVEWVLELWAKNDKDANRKLEALKRTARVEAKIIEEIDE